MALDPELYVCETCAVAEAYDGLDDDNRAAWELFQRVCSRFACETGTSGSVLTGLLSGASPVEYEDTVQRLAVIYNALCPPRKETAPHA